MGDRSFGWTPDLREKMPDPSVFFPFRIFLSYVVPDKEEIAHKSGSILIMGKRFHITG